MTHIVVENTVEDLGAFYSPRPESVLTQITGLTWRMGTEPTAYYSDEDPPIKLESDAEIIPIDRHLGEYRALEKRIVIYKRAIGSLAVRLGCRLEHLLQPVLYHEWSHAILHLGCDASGRQCDLESYGLIDELVHESVVQLLTHRGLTMRAKSTEGTHARAAWQNIQSVIFPELENRQSAIYRTWHQFESIDEERLRRLLPVVRTGMKLSSWEGFSVLV